MRESFLGEKVKSHNFSRNLSE